MRDRFDLDPFSHRKYTNEVRKVKVPIMLFCSHKWRELLYFPMFSFLSLASNFFWCVLIVFIALSWCTHTGVYDKMNVHMQSLCCSHQITLVVPRKFKGGICCGSHLAVTYGGELYCTSGFVLS